MFTRANQLRALVLQTLPLFGAFPAVGVAQTLYDTGNPTAWEQAYIELMNRARANPAAEGERLAAISDPDILNMYSYFNVDLAMMQDEFNVIAPAPPLAPNAKLTDAARSHSQWMLDNDTQSHNQTNPFNTPAERITQAGYDWWICGENVFSYSENVWFGHAGFQVDWGTGGTGGMQNPRGHRESIHNPDYREVGVGVVHGTNGSVGPQLVTQDFAEPYAVQSFGTGVAYYDLNSNNFYDIGEGIEGLTVTTPGVSYYCKTAVGGGWAFPIPDVAATRVLTFSGLGIQEVRNLEVPASTNAKADLKLDYSPPMIEVGTPGTGSFTHVTSFTPVGGATGYKWKLWNTAAAGPENCDSLAGVTTSTVGSYSVLNTAVKSQGSASFHLANPGVPAVQAIQLNPLFFGGVSPELSFMSRLRYSTTSEYHRVEVRELGSDRWLTVDEQLGGTAEPSFSLRSIDLAEMSGRKFHVRFVLSFTSGSTYGNTADIYGWFIDAISFNGTSVLTNLVTETLDGVTNSFSSSPGSYLVAVSPIISGIEFPAGIHELSIAATLSTFSTWAASMESAAGLAAGAISDHPNADHDHDGHSNLVEYAFGTSPISANESRPHMPVLFPGTGDFIIRYTRDTSLTDISVVAVACPDMSDWKSPDQAGAPAGFTDTIVSSDGVLELREARIPAGSVASCFMSVRVTRN